MEQLPLLDAPEEGAIDYASLPFAERPWIASNGMAFPRGTLLKYQASEEELEDLERDSINRGVRVGDQIARHIRRSAKEEALLEQLCAWVDTFGVDIFGAVTFSPKYAAKRGIYTLPRALADVRQGLREMPMNHGKRKGTRGRFALAGEWHRSDREVPHVHFMLSCDGEPVQAVCTELWTYFFTTRGRTRCEPVLDIERGTRYAFKDVLKQSIEHPEALDLCTTRPKRVRRP